MLRVALCGVCGRRPVLSFWWRGGAVIVVVIRRLRDGWIRASCAGRVFSVGVGSALFVLITCYLCFVSEVDSCG